MKSTTNFIRINDVLALKETKTYSDGSVFTKITHKGEVIDCDWLVPIKLIKVKALISKQV